MQSSVAQGTSARPGGALWLKTIQKVVVIHGDCSSLFSGLRTGLPLEIAREQLPREALALMLQSGGAVVDDNFLLRLDPSRAIAQVEDGQDNRWHMPHEVMIELTSRCNLSCSYCCLGELPSKGDQYDMSPAQLHSLVDQFVDSPAFQMTVTGGEPLLWQSKHNVLFDEIRRVSTLGTYVTIFTNGVLLERYSSELSDSFDHVQVSIDSHDALGFRLATSGTTSEFARIKRGLETLSARIDVSLNAVINRRNHRTVNKLIAWASDRGVRRITLSREFEVGKALEDCSQALNDAEWDRVVMLCKEGGYVSYRVLMDSPSEISSFPFGSCKVGRSFVVINYDGSVSPCIGYKRDQRLDIKTRSVRDMWHDSVWQTYRQSSVSCPVPKRNQIVVQLR